LQAGSGGISLATNTSLAAGANFTFGSGAGNFDQSSSTGTFKTGSGAVGINGDTTIAANKSLTYTAGSGNFDQSGSTGTFKTGSGAVSLNGDTTVASSKNFTVTSGTSSLNGATTVKVNSATAFQVQDASNNTVFAVDTTGAQIALGKTGTSTGKIVFYGSTAASGKVTLSGPSSPNTGNYTLSIPAITANANICTDNSICSGYADATTVAGKLNKNNTDTSTAAVIASNYLYTFTNSSSAVASGVLTLDNGTNTASTLKVTASGNPTAGNALIFAANTNASAAGNLIDLQSGSTPTSKFKVDASGNITATGTYRGNTFDSGNLVFSAGSSALLDSASGQTLNVGTSNATGITIGGTTNTTSISLQTNTTGSLSLQSGTGGINIGTNGTANTIQIGNTSGAVTQTVNLGTNATVGSRTDVNVGSTKGASTTTIEAGTGALTIENQGTGAINLATNAVNSTINIGKTGSTAAATTLNLATSTGSGQTIYIGGTNTSSATSSAGTTINLQGGATGLAVTNSGTSISSYTNSATAFQVQNTSGTAFSVFAVDTAGQSGRGQIVLGSSNNATGTIAFKGSSGTGTLYLQGPSSPNSGNYTLSIPVITANDTICTNGTLSTSCSNYAPASGANYIAKNTNDTSSASYLGTLLGLSNTNAGAAGVLSLTNAGTNSALSVSTSANPTSGQAVILVKNTNATPSGNLLDLQSGSTPTSKFSVDASGNLLASGTYNSNTFTSTQLQFGGNSGPTSINNANPGWDLDIGTNSTANVVIGNNSNLGGLVLQAGGAEMFITNAANAGINIGANSVSGTTVNIGKVGTTPNTSTVNIATSNGAQQLINIGGGGSGVASSNANTSVTLQGGATVLAVANTGTTVRTFTNSATAFQVQAATNNLNIFTVDTTGNQVVLGTSGASGANGKLVFNNTTNSNTTTLSVVAPTTGNININLPNEAGTLCIQSSTNCGFLTGTQNSYIKNQSTQQAGANLHIDGTAQADTSVLSPLVDGTGTSLGLGTSATNTTTAVTVGNTSLSGALTLQGGASSGISLITGSSAGTAGTINIGNTTGANTQAINIGTNATASSTTNVTIGSTIGASKTTLQSGTAGVVVRGANTTNAFQVQNANGSSILDVDTTNGNVGIGTSSPSNLFSVSPTYYSTGTAYQDDGSGGTGTIIHGVGTTWTSSMVGMTFLFNSGQKETITGFTSTTQLTGNVSQLVSANPGIAYEIHQPSFYVNSSGQVSARSFTSSASAFQVQNAAGNGIFTVDASYNSGAGAIVLGTANANVGTIAFKGSGTGTLYLAGPSSPNSGNYTLSIPAITANDTICTNTTQSSCTNYAPATGGGGYIQNQNSIDQVGANFRIDGTGRAATSFIAPSFDRATAGALSVGTSANTTSISLGNSSMTGAFNLQAGTGALNLSTAGTGGIAIQNNAAGNIGIGSNAMNQNITIGNITGNSSLNLYAGTGNFLLDGQGATTYSIGASTTTGTISIGGISQTGAITIGNSYSDQTFNIGGGPGGIKTVNIGSNISSSSVNVTAGTGNITIQNQGGLTAANAINIGTNSVDNIINIGKNVNVSGQTQLNVATTTASQQTINVGGNATSGGSNSLTTINLQAGSTLVAVSDSSATVKSFNNSQTAFMVQDSGNSKVLAVDATNKILKVYDASAANYAIVQYTGGSAVFSASSGTTAVGNGTGSVSITPGSGYGVSITGTADSSWVLSSIAAGGTLLIDNTSGTGTPLINIGTGPQAKTVNIGTSTGAVVQTFNLGNNATAGSQTTVNIGSAIGASATTINGGSGNVTINGGTTVIKSSTTAFQVQASAGAAGLAYDSSGKQLKIYENGGTTNYALIYYDTSSGTANYTANAGTVALGRGAGSITINSGTGGAVNITADSASTFRTTTGSLTLQSASGSNLILSAGSSIISVNGSSVVQLGASAGDPGTCTVGAIVYNSTSNTFRGCMGSPAAWANLGTITPTLQNDYTASTGGTTPEIKLDSTRGGLDIQDADTSLSGSLFAVHGSNVAGMGTNIFTISSGGTNTIQIGSSSGHSSNPVVLGLDNYANSGADPSGFAGAMYYNGTNNKFRCYENGAWTNCVNGPSSTVSTTTASWSSSITKAAANTIYIVPVYIPGPLTVNEIRVDVTSALGAAGDVGLYDANGNLVLNGGSSSLTTTTGFKSITPTQTGNARILGAGQYYAAITWNSTSGTVVGATVLSGQIKTVGTLATGGLVLPSTISVSSITTGTNLPGITFNN
jgi:hypothetical protein